MKVESLQDREDSVEELSRNTFEDVYFEAVSKARDILASLNSSSNQQSVNTSGSTNSKIQLPILTLPNFDGEYTKYGYYSKIHIYQQ